MITLTGACTTLAAEQTPVSIHVYGPGGPAPAMKAAAELFEQRTVARASIMSGPLPKWEDAARLDADVFFSGSENMMTEFSTAFEGQDDAATVEPLYIRPSTILVRPGRKTVVRGSPVARLSTRFPLHRSPKTSSLMAITCQFALARRARIRPCLLSASALFWALPATAQENTSQTAEAAGQAGPVDSLARSAPSDQDLSPTRPAHAPAAIGLEQSEDGFSITGQFRVRGEAIGGQFRSFGPDSEELLLLQTRVNAQYKAGNLVLGGEIMDARAYSTADNSTLRQAEVNALEPLQYWAQYDLGEGLGDGTNTTLKLGQQRMLLGSVRLINNPLFRNTSNTYLGLRGDIKRSNRDSLTAFYVLPTRILPDDVEGYYDNRVEVDRSGFDLQLMGAFYHRKVAELNLQLYAYYLDERDSLGFQTRNRKVWTPGMRLSREAKRGKMDFEFEGILQRGQARRTAAATDVNDRDVRAYYLYGELGYRLDNAVGPRFAVSATYGSGQNDSDNITRFDQLFGAIFPDYAPPGLYGPTTLSNVSSFGADMTWTPGKWTIWNTYRRLRAPEPNDVYGRTAIRNAPNGKVGDQFFLRARYPISPKVRFELGGALLLKGDFLKEALGAINEEDTRYIYSDLTFVF